MPCHWKLEARNRKLTVFAVFYFSVYCGLTSLLQVEWARTEDSSKPNLKNEDPSGTEIQLCTRATIRRYSEAVKKSYFAVVVFFQQ